MHRGLTVTLLLIGSIWGFRVNVTSMKCSSVSPTFAKIVQCDMNVLRGNEVSIYVKLLQLPVTNATVKLELFKQGIFKPRMSFFIDACTFMVNRQNPLASYFFELSGLMKYSNINHTCPYNHDLIVDRFHLDYSNITPFRFIPSGSYTIKTYWSANYRKRGSFILTFEWTNQAY